MHARVREVLELRNARSNTGETADALVALGGRVITHVVDVADPKQIEALADAVYAEDRAVDLLHNDAFAR